MMPTRGNWADATPGIDTDATERRDRARVVR
jgi:hypothetical protein